MAARRRDGNTSADCPGATSIYAGIAAAAKAAAEGMLDMRFRHCVTKLITRDGAVTGPPRFGAAAVDGARQPGRR